MFQRYAHDDEARRKLLRKEKDAITKEFNEMRRAISVFREYCDDRNKQTYAECERKAIEENRYYVKSDDEDDDEEPSDGGSSSTDDQKSDDGGKPGSTDDDSDEGGVVYLAGGNGGNPGSTDDIMPPGDEQDKKLTPEEEAQKILENAKKNAKDIAEFTGALTNGDTPLAQLGRKRGHVKVVKRGGAGPSKKPKNDHDGKEPGGDFELLADQSKHKDIGSFILFRDTNVSRKKYKYAEPDDEVSNRHIHTFVKAHILNEIGDDFILEFKTMPDWNNIRVTNKFVNYWKKHGDKLFKEFMN